MAAVLICIQFSGLRDLGLGNKELICFGSAELLQVQRWPSSRLLQRPLKMQQESPPATSHSTKQLMSDVPQL